MVNTTYCDICNHEYKCCNKNHLQTNKQTFNLFRQISPFERETKRCDVCSNDVLKESYKKTPSITKTHKHSEKVEEK